MFQWLWFSDPFKGITFNLFDQSIDSPEDFLVIFLPVKIILPRMIGKNELHSLSFLSIPLSSASWTMDSISRLVFWGERKR
jgi:hypothetical protein